MFTLKRIYSSSLVRKSFIYVFCDGINRAIPFLLLPFITHYLTPSDYGIVTNFNVYIQILSVFCYTCTAGALPVMFYKLEREKVKQYVSNMMVLNTGVTVLCALVSLSMFVYVEDILNLSICYQFYALVVVWFAGITNINMILWRCEEKPVSFGIYQISQSALNALTTILFVIIFLLGWEGRVYSMMLVTILFGFISLYILYKRGYFVLELDKMFIKQTLFFALPIIPHALSFWFKSGVDKIMLTNMCGLNENGLYSVAMTWGAIVSMFVVSFNNAYTPFLYKKLAIFDKDKTGTVKEQKELVRLIWGSFVVALVFVAFAYLISVYLIKLVYAPIYYDSLDFLPWVMIAQLFYAGYSMFVCFIHYTFKTKMLGIITFSWSIAQIGITYLLIGSIGAVGASISSAIVSMMTFVFVAIYAMKVYHLPWFSLKND